MDTLIILVVAVVAVGILAWNADKWTKRKAEKARLQKRLREI
jgi:hypothetical protein